MVAADATLGNRLVINRLRKLRSQMIAPGRRSKNSVVSETILIASNSVDRAKSL